MCAGYEMQKRTILQKNSFIRKQYRKAIFLPIKYFCPFSLIHINKTGGTSIEKALGMPLIHKTAIDYRNEIGEARWKKRFSFAIIRNPWDKVVSQYKYRTLINDTQLRNTPIAFNEWVKRVFLDNDPIYYDEPIMFMPQLNWVVDENGKIIVDFIGRFENLDNDWSIICEKLNKPNLKLPHVKKTEKKDFRSYYNDQSIDIIAQFFRRDIDEFGYAFR